MSLVILDRQYVICFSLNDLAGNLFLAAMNGISENFEQAVRSTGEVLAVQGRGLAAGDLPCTIRQLLEEVCPCTK